MSCDVGGFVGREGQMRQFETGATRDSEEGKLDFEGFLSPVVLARFAEYMHKHRLQADGNLRSSDNWQKGIPKTAYMKSMWRHFMDVWRLHRAALESPLTPVGAAVLEEALCAMLFNVQGYLFEVLTRPEHRLKAPAQVVTPKGSFATNTVRDEIKQWLQEDDAA